MMLSSSEVEGSGSRSRNISPVTSGGREISLMKLGVMWLAVIPPVEETPSVVVAVVICKCTSLAVHVMHAWLHIHMYNIT